MKVAIVGAGPSGMTAALLLAQGGVAVTVFEQRDGSCNLPSAHVVNCRTNEIFREIGVFDAVAAAAAPAERMRYVTWSESLSGARYGRIPYQGDVQQIAQRLAASPARTVNIGQDLLERILCAHFEETGNFIRFGHQVIAATQDDTHARLTIIDPAGSEIAEVFDYVLACDGASSTVRRALGIEMEGPASLARVASAYFKANLSPYLGDDMGPVHFIGNADVRGAIIGFDLDKIWALMCPMLPSQGPENFTPAVMETLIRRAVGDPDMAIDLIGVGSWNMSAQVAAQFRKGRFFLVGDSAHRFPPSGGLGLNTGVQDAHNLAWKLALVANGNAEPALLDTYGTERRPVAQRNCQHSVTNAMRMAEVDVTLGISLSEPVDAAVAERPASPPRGWTAAPDGLSEDACRMRTQKSIDDQRAHFDSLAMEIGYCYTGEPAAIPDDHELYQPVITIGARLPHFWLDAESLISSHDVLSRSAMTLMSSNPAWESIANAFSLEFRLIDTVRSATPQCWSDAIDSGHSGAVLVRPDDHVAWSSVSGPDEQASASLSRAVCKWYGKCA